MKYIKGFIFGLIFMVFALLFAGVNYVTPAYNATYVTGLEVKRVDKDGPITKANPADGPTRDVYYIYTKKEEGAKPMVYRNEDTRWGFPFYFKFGSADLQANASGFQENKQLVQVKSYGWRLKMWDEYPNIVSIKPLDKVEDLGRPWLAYTLYVLLLIAFVVVVQFVRGWFDSRK